ncbi:hypothetical protein GNX71_11800 [Variovorax sp. RKNM96]|uniref:hypothetical protein n=1 Tax=Variovorax sp. RKNM96 TaxID=2681552 RepID=UPI00197EC1A3|nr:hypothetical protein [Variovorax sp. RKNM96]QSI30230.1 hypothetical protein GNX71_11800 [Variovorax sp. RKNM96]
MKTMKSFPRMLVAGLAIASAMAVHARADGAVVPPQVSTVATGGDWNTARTGGALRVIIVHEGFEHVHSKLWLEWISIGEREERRLAARVLVKELSNGFSSVRLDDRREVFSGSQIRLRAANPYSAEDNQDVTIEAGKPGQYKIVLQPAR